MIDLAKGNGQKSSLGDFALRYSFLLHFSIFVFLFSFNPISLRSLGCYMFAKVSFKFCCVLSMLDS